MASWSVQVIYNNKLTKLHNCAPQGTNKERQHGRPADAPLGMERKRSSDLMYHRTHLDAGPSVCLHALFTCQLHPASLLIHLLRMSVSISLLYSHPLQLCAALSTLADTPPWCLGPLMAVSHEEDLEWLNRASISAHWFYYKCSRTLFPSEMPQILFYRASRIPLIWCVDVMFN